VSVLSRLSLPLQKVTAKIARWGFIKKMAPAAKQVERLLGWDGGLAALLFSFGWGFLQGKNFPVARLFFTASCIFLALKAISEARKFEGAKARVTGSVVAVFLGGLLWVTCWFWVFHNESQEPKPEFFTWLWSYISWIRLLPFRRILLAVGITGLIGSVLIVFVQQRRERCPDKRLHEWAKEDRANIARRVRIVAILYRPNFDEFYIDFIVGVFNNSLYDIVIVPLIESGEILVSYDYKRFHYEPKFTTKERIYCGSRSSATFVVRQALRDEEITRFFKDVDDTLFTFGNLRISFRGTTQFAEIGTEQLDTNYYVQSKKGVWSADDPVIIFGLTDEQWAALKSLPRQELTTLSVATPPPKVSSIPEEKPNLVFKGVGRLHAYSLHGYPLEEGHSPDSNRNSSYQVIALTVRVENEFSNKFKTVPVRGVTAQVSYHYQKGEPFQINRGAWLGSGNRASFDVNDLHDLVIATVMGEGDGRFVYAINREYREDQGFDNVGVVLSEDVYDIRVRVISESEGLLHFEKQLVLSVTESPKFRVSLSPADELDPSEENADDRVTDSE
jgi:hypothetical protein